MLFFRHTKQTSKNRAGTTFNKLKLATKNSIEVTLRLPSHMIGNSDNETNFPHNLLLTDRQVCGLRKAFSDMPLFHTDPDFQTQNSFLIPPDSVTSLMKKSYFYLHL